MALSGHPASAALAPNAEQPVLNTSIAPDAALQRATDERTTYAKVTWRLLPLLLAAYVVAYLDRVNAGFAKLQMTTDLHFSDAVYGFGAGIFFISHFLFEVPSNIILHRVGARV